MTPRMTVDEFYLLQDPPGARLELHDGIPVRIPIESTRHSILANHLAKLLDIAFDGKGMAWVELPFRPEPEYELRAANVGWICEERELAIDPDDYLRGAPDIAVEITSRNKTRDQIEARMRVFFACGCREFWIVDPIAKRIEVADAEGPIATYERGHSVRIGKASFLVESVIAFRSIGGAHNDERSNSDGGWGHTPLPLPEI
jgi:Uma2 family endonuclease